VRKNMSDYSVEDIIRAKRIVRNSGYTVELPKDEVEQARNIAMAAGYNVRKADEPAPAAKPAEAPAPAATPETKPAAAPAPKANPAPAAPEANPAPAPAPTGTETSAAPAPAPAEEQPKKSAFDYSMDIASRYL
jgi:hypothetical protein